MTGQHGFDIPGERKIFFSFLQTVLYEGCLLLNSSMIPEAGLLPARSSRGLSSAQPFPRLFPSGCYLNGLQGDGRVG